MSQNFLDSYDSSKPFWVIGPSSKVLDYKDFILNNLKDCNTITVGHCLHELSKKWNFHPTFSTWYDAHQTLKLLEDFESGEPDPLSHCYNTIIIPPKFVEFKNYFSALGTGKKPWDKYFRLIKHLKSNPNINYQPIQALNVYGPIHKGNKAGPWWKLHNGNSEIIQEIINNPELRFLNKEFMFCGSGVGLENLLSRLIFPTLFKLKAKKVFVLGFDGCHGRFYSHNAINLPTKKNPKLAKKYLANGWPSYINPIHKSFLHIEKWLEWQQFHNMEIYNVQENTPLRNKLEYLSPEDAIKK